MGALGGLIASWIEMPLPWMLGSMIATTLAAMLGAPVEGPNKIRKWVAPVIGVLLGAGFTPELFGNISGWIVTLLLLPPFLVVAFALPYLVYRKIGGYDHTTAFFSAAPGGLVDMVVIGGQNGGHEGKIALAHAGRILIVITCVVLFYSFFLGANANGQERPFVTFSDLSVSDYVLLTLSGGLGVWLAPKLRMPAPIILGPMLVSGGFHLADLTSAAPPTILVLIAQWVIGSSVGCRFKGTSFQEITRDLSLAVVSSAVMLTVALSAALLLTQIEEISLAGGFLAFSPGGLFEMSLLALSMGIDGAYVATTHIIRIALIISVTPFVFDWLKRR